MAEENSNKRIARNTMLLYTRSLINLVIGLYTSRLTLDALGNSGLRDLQRRRQSGGSFRTVQRQPEHGHQPVHHL